MEYTNVRAANVPAAGGTGESLVSAVSWAAVIAGAFVAAALSLVLLVAGSGLGFASLSPWNDAGATAKAVGIAAVIWLIVVQVISSGLGGYIAGRLRTKWVDTHSDEVYFRDTAHGFLVWAVGAVIALLMVSSIASSLIGGAAKVAGGAVAGAGAAAASTVGAVANGNQPSTDYLVDTLFRADQPSATGNPADSRAEVGRIFAASIGKGDMSAEDRTYVAKVVAQQTGVDQATAEKRVNDLVDDTKANAEKAKQTALEAADAARRGAALFALWALVSLLAGAFSASYAATIGGRARDRLH